MAELQDQAACAEESCIPCMDENTQIESRFECPVCLQYLKDPVLTTCGHRFCKNCIDMWLKRQGGCCPIDNQPLNADRDLFPDNFTRREIKDLEPHTAQCNHQKEDDQPITCSFKDVGCSAMVTREQMAAHLEMEIHHHLNLLSIAYSKLSTSVSDQEDTKAQEASTMWDPDKGKSPINGDSKWQGLVRSLYERIVLLEQHNHEQDIQLENIKRQLTTGMDKIAQDLGLRYCGGTYVWKLCQFSSRLAAMQSDPTRCMYYSPGFYTSPTGYRFCARLNLSSKDRGCLTLLIHVMQGENDAYLDWPFIGRISFTLINRANPQQNLKETMISRPELDAFKRPAQHINPRGFGYPEFVPLLDLTALGFLTDDNLTIRIHIQTV